MGEVYRARDTRLGRFVAIKVLPSFLSHDPERLRRFELEARAAAALNHPNILAVFQMETYEGAPYLVSELLEGATLREHLAHGPLPVRKAVDYGVQIAQGLSAAHEKGITHRDLKPENLFVMNDGRIKILDFGLAKLTQPQSPSPETAQTATLCTDPGVVLGTVSYMSPEQVRGRWVDHRADIFAFGVILYEMLTGKRAFQNPTSPETMSAILNEEPRPISELALTTPPALQKIVLRCLEKNPEQRFQSSSDLAFALESLSDSGRSSALGVTAADRHRGYWWAASAVLLVLSSLGALLYVARSPGAPSTPNVSGYMQLTHDGEPKELVGTDGSRLYYNVGSGTSAAIGQVSSAGGETARIATASAGRYLVGVSADGAELLAADTPGAAPGPLWRVPVLGGSPRRLGETIGQSAAWSPDGKTLAYGNGNDLFLAGSDGSKPHKLVPMMGRIDNLSWSQDGSELRVTVMDVKTAAHSLWEVSLNGTDPRALLGGWHDPADECCGKWTSDGKYFVFQSRGQIWALAASRGLFRKATTKPFQLTSSPMDLADPLPSRDGKRLFVVGGTRRGELVRWDSKSRQFAPFLSGISAQDVSFSRDGQWVAYASYPEGTIWRSKLDGSQRLQLSFPPLYGMLPRWSPDGKQIVFFDFSAGKPATLYLASADGSSSEKLMAGDIQQATDPGWSPDGAKIVFGGVFFGATAIHVLDMRTHQVSTLPASEGLYAPRLSPDGRYVAAMPVDQLSVMLYDFETQHWVELVKANAGYPNWSKDGKYLYFLGVPKDPAVLRVRISDHKLERVVDLKDSRMGGYFGFWLGLAPDDSPLLLRDTGSQEIYALDWVTP
jgi:Tol biopolymer transport system component